MDPRTRGLRHFSAHHDLHTLLLTEDWPKKLQALLPKDRPYLDSVVDSAGGNIVTQLGRILKHGARVSVYGQ